MMLKEIKEMLECDVLGNDMDYITKLNSFHLTIRKFLFKIMISQEGSKV